MSNIETVFLDAVNTAADTEPWTAKIRVNNSIEIRFKLDTGTDVSVISTGDKNRIGNITETGKTALWPR